jgi:CRISPR-associated endonuclease/helicase Cas3
MREFSTLDAAGALEVIDGKFPVLRNLRAYRDDVGLRFERGEVWHPFDLMV